MNLKPMKTIKFGPESPNTYEVTDAQARGIIQTLENKLSLKLDKSIIKTTNPTSSTIGMVGQTFINSISESVFICVKSDNTNKIYVWKDISEVDLSNYYTKEEIDNKILTVYKFKGSVNTFNSLPSTAENGDVYNTTDTGMNYAWNGTEWDALGSDVDLSSYYTKEESSSIFASTTDIELLKEQINVKADVETTYTKTEVDDLISNIDVDSLPSQADNAGKVLTTDGTDASWQHILNVNDVTEGSKESLSKLVINKLTQAEYDELLANDQINDNEIYVTTDTDYYTKKEVDNLIASVGGSTTFIFNQEEPLKEWIIEHNLNKYPYIVTVDLNGEEIIGDKTYIDNNIVKVTFTSLVSGKAYLN